jgi:multiple sugar transport system substrate-binding protein
MFQYLGVAGPYVIGERNPDAFWFDPVTLDPLIASEGHVEALQTFKRLFELGPAEQLEWTLADAWQHFLEGHAAFAIAPADLLTFAIDLKYPLRGQIGVASLPGTTAYVDPLAGTRHETESSNVTGNAQGACWGGVLRTSSDMPETAFHFLAMLGETDRQRAFGWSVDDGVDPARASQMPTEVSSEGRSPLDDFVVAGFTEAQAMSYTGAIQ